MDLESSNRKSSRNQAERFLKVVRNLKWRVVGCLSHTFSTGHNLMQKCLIKKSLNTPDRTNIRAYAEFVFAQDSLFGKVQQKAQMQ